MNEIKELPTHLTASEMDRWMVEGPWPDAAEHVRSCRSCQATLAEAQTPLAMFRDSLVAWSEAQTPAFIQNARPSFRERMKFMNWFPAFGLAAAMALLAGLLVVPGVFRVHVGSQEAHNAVPPVSDAALMEQVDQEVSETVPDAMAPLADMVAWDSTENRVAPVEKKNAKKHGAGAAKAKSGIE